MKLILKLASYLFHPLWMPFAGSLFYFLLTPRYFPMPIIKAKLMAIAIITIFIPIVFYFLLKNLGKAKTIFLEKPKERKWPLFFFMLLSLMVLNQILNVYNYPALFYYFLGILISSGIAFMLTWLKFKASLHMVGMAGLLMFVTGFSIHFHLYFIYTICFLMIATGLTASSRLYYKAHTPQELFAGFLIGLIPQIIVLNFWL
ncbi:hypothetical protein [Christiangramia salexigens]|uniref:Phosphatidic acid phosphatase type 2/haloperoxidase domain-containing protein n=1 Tax=Christiangramia salexigens TaxID=1913577 RepID=A0A1L3J5U0_9FLAO|nr:hypothetical protein [Christiangramia salexigens]APG60482.1 hypothetical protein LPB144_08730 [Christiangramia salexigens]